MYFDVHTVCHVAKSGLCSHNLSFCVHKFNVSDDINNHLSVYMRL